MASRKLKLLLLLSFLNVPNVGCEKADPRFQSPLGEGAKAPEIAASAWLNGTPPSTDGKVIVVDCWGFW